MPILQVGSKGKEVLRVSAHATTRLVDQVAEEEPLEIALHYRGRRLPVAITMRTPGQDLQLAIGFLFTEGIIPPNLPVGGGAQVRVNAVELPCPPGFTPDLRRTERHSYTSSSCGVCGKTALDMVYQTLPFPECPASWGVEPAVLHALPPALRRAQELFQATGGLHAVGLFTREGELAHLAEDVGRHNALDKLIGHGYQSGLLPFSDHLLLLSGRASFELIQKAAMAGISFVASVGAPSSLAVELAEDQGITLCGFLRATTFNCYTHPERIALPEAGT